MFFLCGFRLMLRDQIRNMDYGTKGHRAGIPRLMFSNLTNVRIVEIFEAI